MFSSEPNVRRYSTDGGSSILEGKSGAGSQWANSVVSRVKFAVPVVFPEYEAMRKIKPKNKVSEEG